MEHSIVAQELRGFYAPSLAKTKSNPIICMSNLFSVTKNKLHPFSKG